MPSRMYRNASPTATMPLAHEFEFVVPTPRKPHSMAIFEWAEPPNTCSARVGFTPRQPFLRKRWCSNSAFAIPPSAVPKLTPTRACGLSRDQGRPASSRASRAEATANCA